MILRKVLGCIYEKGYIKADEISQELGVSSGLVEYATQKLKEMEYLKVVTPLNEEASCGFCPLRTVCHIKNDWSLKLYTLTAKGKKLLEGA